ncbi:YciK family oxidoreductase [Alteromonas oceanisediminis]|uniref:YciK family oxidoreductase n=1 Tax=Alteromonas oceanisediminis TaxID=2836180 RepID=UPI001BD96DA9|nr:YciK family oxidoreductase [Alteromonas oceanisediminis]MBT0586449.1 YciK family oxidoreductase [Alteromonas oceanisediminis]
MPSTFSFSRSISVANSFTAPLHALRDKVILITGAGDGIGKEIALSYAKHGAICILLGRTVSKLEAVYDEIIESGGQEPAIVPLDLNGATPQNYSDMGSTIIDQFKQLDGLVLNASVLGMLCPFAEIKPNEWQEAMQVNVNANAYLIQGLLPALKKSPSASVIFTTSSVGRQGRKFWGAYSVSKFATEGMMEVLADEFQAEAIRFNCINPGATRTDMRAKAYPAEDKSQLKTPEEIMPTYLYLMCSESQSVTGSVFDCQPK